MHYVIATVHYVSFIYLSIRPPVSAFRLAYFSNVNTVPYFSKCTGNSFHQIYCALYLHTFKLTM